MAGWRRCRRNRRLYTSGNRRRHLLCFLRPVCPIRDGKTDNRKGFQELTVQLETGDEVFAFIGKTTRLQNESAIFPVTGGKIKVHTDMLPTFYEMEEEGWVELPLDQFENIIIDLLDMYGNN